MSDATLEEKERRVAEIKKRIAWFQAESRDLKRRYKFVREYHDLMAKKKATRLTREEKDRWFELAKLPEVEQDFQNVFDWSDAGKELQAAIKDLEEYRRKNITAQGSGSLPIESRPAGGAAVSELQYEGKSTALEDGKASYKNFSVF